VPRVKVVKQLCARMPTGATPATGSSEVGGP
jgi:hypothetical protein